MMNKNKLALALAATFVFAGSANAALHISPVKRVAPAANFQQASNVVVTNSNTANQAQKFVSEIAPYKPTVSVKLPVKLMEVEEDKEAVSKINNIHVSLKPQVEVPVTEAAPEVAVIEPELELPKVEDTEEAEVPAQPVMSFGERVPLEVALENVVPNFSDWSVHYDDSLEKSRVNWNGGSTWEEVLEEISKSNNVSVHLNKDDQVIGVAKLPEHAEAMSSVEPKLWTIVRGSTLRKTLNVWGKRAGWDVHWDQNFELDFPIVFDAKLVGDFEGSNGVLHKLISSVSKQGQPISAVFYTKNRVVFIKEGGFKQDVN